MSLEMYIGNTYSLKLKDFEIPTGGVIPGETKVREILKYVEIDGLEFVRVRRENQSTHLIAVETIESATLLTQVPECTM